MSLVNQYINLAHFGVFMFSFVIRRDNIFSFITRFLKSQFCTCHNIFQSQNFSMVTFADNITRISYIDKASIHFL